MILSVKTFDTSDDARDDGAEADSDADPATEAADDDKDDEYDLNLGNDRLHDESPENMLNFRSLDLSLLAACDVVVVVVVAAAVGEV